MGVLEDLANIGNGIRSGVQDVPSLLKNVVELDGHGIVTDSRKIIGDVGDVIDGVSGLGIELGKAPARYAGSLGKLADSPILSAAQLVIEGEKATTGSGDPHGGNGYAESATKLDETIQTLISAEVNADVWDGAASTEYDNRSKAHRRLASDASVADADTAAVLNRQAEQIVSTRKTLDTASQSLSDYGLATAWMNFVPGLNLTKSLGDMAAASAALATTQAAMLTMINNALMNSLDFDKSSATYESVVKNDTSGGGGACGTFVDPRDDQLENLPTRLHPETKYTYPAPTEPPRYGPPATPYGGSPEPEPSGARGPSHP